MGFNVTVTPVVQEVEISANVTPYEVQVTANQDLIDYVNEAKQSADEAEASAISADNSADSALASATSATASANSATSSASSASSSASTATTQAGIATTKANEASQSATNALASEQASAISEANALQSEQNALASEQSALASANTATSQAGIATTKAGEASASASSALASQNSATASASTATTQAGIATTQASNALASANAAAASAASAAQVGTSTLLTGFSVGSNTAIAGTDTILQAFNKTQGQINARVSGTGTSGQVAFWNGTSSQTGSNNLFWDSANGRLGIGTNSPISNLTVRNSSSSYASFFGGGVTSPNWVGFGTANAGVLPFIQGINNALSSNVALAINPSGGNVLINTLTDAGFRLDVAGSTRIVPPADTTGLTLSGYSLTGSGTTPAIDVSGTWNTTGTPTLIRANVTDTASNGSSLLMDLRVGGVSRFLVFKSGLIGLNNNSSFLPSGTGASDSRLQIFGGTGGAVGSIPLIHLRTNNNITSTTGSPILVQIGQSFLPTSGTADYTLTIINPTINQTGGANGITRGLFVSPTLTSAADWRSIEWSNNTGWGLYGIGTANNYLGGRLGIGSTTLTDINFRVSSALTGSTGPVAIVADGIVSSTSTNIAAYFLTFARTENAVFTLPVLNHFNARQGTFGASSIVTEQNGFLVQNTLIGATNNYGFRGTLNSATGRWNLYMDGTASNYLRGNLLLNTTTDAGFLLDVNGTARFSNDVTIADTRNIILSTTTGTRIGTATNQRLALWNATPNVQPTNAITAAAFVANTSGIVNDTATFGGYTIGQIVAALQRIGALA